MERPIPYGGEKEYIFVSYSHRDAQRVWPIISRMIEDGFRVWYDDGIDPGTEWDENIAAHVVNCGYFVAFLSENYLNSNNCKDELNFSRDQGKQQLLIYLEDVELPQGMAMRLGRNQAIFHNRYRVEADFYSKLYDAQGILMFNGSNQPPQIKKASGRQPRPKKKTALWPILVAVLIVAGAAVFFLWAGGQNPSQTPGQAKPEASDQVVPETPAESGTQVTNVVLAETDELKITVLDAELDSRYYALTLNIKNKTKADIYLSTEACHLNGIYFEPEWNGMITAEEDNLTQLYWDRETAAHYQIDLENVSLVELAFGGSFQDNSGDIEAISGRYCPYGEEKAVLAGYVPAETDLVLLDTPEVFAAVVDYTPGSLEEGWRPEIVCVNRTESTISVGAEGEILNQYLYDSHWGMTVQPGRTRYAQIYIPGMDWMITDYDRVLSYAGELQVHYWESFAGDTEELASVPFAIFPEGEEAAEQLCERQISQEELLVQTQFLRTAYLGSREYSGRKADLIYLQNLNDHTRKFVVTFERESGTTVLSYELDAGQELVIPVNREESVFGKEEMARLVVSMMDRELSDYSEYEEAFYFVLRDPDE